jgi:hydroxymethylpyrimidine pyrophosphatase-like HAD family hydrolase
MKLNMLNENNDKKFLGVDLDGTLAHWDDVWKGPTHIGDPIPKMVNRVKRWLKDGKKVKIFTARVSNRSGKNLETIKKNIEKWLIANIGQKLPITSDKSRDMIEIWDDRAVGVKKNTGERV